MKKTFVIISGLVFFAMISCAPKQNETKETQLQDQSQSQLKVISADTLGTTSDVTPAQEVIEQKSTAVVLNPPHGQPGHLCEIPVGSPLPSSLAKTAPSTKNIETAQRLNPPHGEPGHRCEIPVGAPLDTPAPTSAPSAASTGSFAPTVENAARLKSGQR